MEILRGVRNPLDPPSLRRPVVHLGEERVLVEDVAAAPVALGAPEVVLVLVEDGAERAYPVRCGAVVFTRP